MRGDRCISTRSLTEYLAALEVAASGIPAERRAELVADVRDHIDYALAEAGGGGDEATVRDILYWLGSPAEIVAAEAWTEVTPVVESLRRSLPIRPSSPTWRWAALAGRSAWRHAPCCC